MVLTPPRLRWGEGRITRVPSRTAVSTGSMAGGLGGQQSFLPPSSWLGWRKSYTTQPTQAPPPRVSAPAPAHLRLPTQQRREDRHTVRAFASYTSPSPSFSGVSASVSFFKSCVTCLPFLERSRALAARPRRGARTSSLAARPPGSL